MPYIEKVRRNKLIAALDGVALEMAGSPGELNFLITKIIVYWLECYGRNTYIGINTVIGVLECAKQELYRRVAAPYEDLKKEENGDVYDERQ